MLKIGITGGIGVGKSTVSTFFSLLGIPIYDADYHSKWLQNNDPSLIHLIKSAFGEDTYLDGKLNSRYLSQIVFADNTKLNQLNSLVHPFVKQHSERWFQQHNHAPYILREAALLIESGSYKQLDKMIVVSSPLDLRKKRIKLRDPQRTDVEIESIIQKQMPESEKLLVADFVIFNDERQSIIVQCLKIDRQLRDICQIRI